MDNQNVQHNPAADEEAIDLRALLTKYVKKWYWFVASVVLCAGIAVVYLKLTPPRYHVQTTILLRDDAANNPMSQLAMFEGFTGTSSSKVVEDEIQVLTTKTIASQLIRSLGLHTEYYERKGAGGYKELYPVSPVRLTLPPAFTDTLTAGLTLEIRTPRKEGDGYTIKFAAGRSKEEYTPERLTGVLTTPYGELKLTEIAPLRKGARYRIAVMPHRLLVERYSQAISVGTVNKHTNAIAASMTSAVPQKAQAVLDCLIELYNQDVVNDKNLIGQNTADFVDKQIGNIERELSEIEVEIERYKKHNRITDISSESKLFLRSIGEYDRQLAEIQTQINLIAYIDEYINREENRFGLIPANLGINDPALVGLTKEYNNALLERMKLLRTTNEQNPVIAQMERTLEVIRESIVASIRSISDGLAISKADLMAKGAQFSSRIEDVPRQEREYIEKMRRREVSQTLYVYLLQKKKENELTLATTLPPAKILDKAYVSLRPVSPRKIITLAIALMLGVCLPLAVIYLTDVLNDKIQDKKEFTRLARPPFLGAISTNKSGEHIVVAEGRVNPIVELFRQLRTNLQFMLTGKTSPVILVTSSVSGEGKSFISTNLAASLALLKKRVVLLGLDIRNPMLGEYMNLPRDHRGITLYLSDPDIELKDIMNEVPGHPGLTVMQGGPVPPNPSELLMSPRLDEMIAELKRSFDYIIIDSAPVGVVSDTFLINRVADNTVYVSRQDYTSRELVSFINDLYADKKLNNMSVVLNGTDEADVYYGYNHKRYLKEK